MVGGRHNPDGQRAKKEEGVHRIVQLARRCWREVGLPYLFGSHYSYHSI